MAVVKPSKATIQKHVEILRKLAKSNKRKGQIGKLPTYTWLEANGYFRSYELLRQYPGYFKGIQRASGK